MNHSDCQIIFEAGKALVEKSGLARYCDPYFVACEDREGFDEYWKEGFHPKFGRYMAWVLFAVGAENLAKAACVCNKVVKVSSKPTLEEYVEKHFTRLCNKAGLDSVDNECRLIEGYERLRKVRNRDAHSYRENVRDANFPLVAKTFVPAFNILMEAIRHGACPLPDPPFIL